MENIAEHKEFGRQPPLFDDAWFSVDGDLDDFIFYDFLERQPLPDDADDRRSLR